MSRPQKAKGRSTLGGRSRFRSRQIPSPSPRARSRSRRPASPKTARLLRALTSERKAALLRLPREISSGGDHRVCRSGGSTNPAATSRAGREPYARTKPRNRSSNRGPPGSRSSKGGTHPSRKAQLRPPRRRFRERARFPPAPRAAGRRPSPDRPARERGRGEEIFR
jgi:hypothetical protein